MSSAQSHLVPSAQAYLSALAWGETPLMARIRERCERAGSPVIGPETGAALRALALAVGARRALEVGTLHGYSALWLLSGMPDGRLETIERDAENAATADAHFREAGVAESVTLHLGAALEVLPRLEGRFDLFFFDAAKEEYPLYLDFALARAAPGAVVLADNVLWLGRVFSAHNTDPDTEGIRRFTRRILEERRLASCLLPVGDGLSVSIVKR